MSTPVTSTTPHPAAVSSLHSQEGPAGANLFIFHLPSEFRREDLFTLFQKHEFGTILSCHVMINKDTNESRGFGFISYSHKSEAREAINQMNGYSILNKRLKVALKRDDMNGGNGNSGGSYGSNGVGDKVGNYKNSNSFRYQQPVQQPSFYHHQQQQQQLYHHSHHPLQQLHQQHTPQQQPPQQILIHANQYQQRDNHHQRLITSSIAPSFSLPPTPSLPSSAPVSVSSTFTLPESNNGGYNSNGTTFNLTNNPFLHTSYIGNSDLTHSHSHSHPHPHSHSRTHQSQQVQQNFIRYVRPSEEGLNIPSRHDLLALPITTTTSHHIASNGNGSNSNKF